jgi:SH3-like domain-containing protein
MMRVKSIATSVLLLAVIFLLGSGKAAAITMVSVAGNNVNMRSGPGSSYTVMWELDKGYPLIVLKRSGKWYQVRDVDGTVGWVHGDLVERTPHMIVKVHKNTGEKINVRSGPGTRYRIVAKARYGVVFRTRQQKNGWVQVEHADGVTGWVKRTLLWGW